MYFLIHRPGLFQLLFHFKGKLRNDFKGKLRNEILPINMGPTEDISSTRLSVIFDFDLD